MATKLKARLAAGDVLVGAVVNILDPMLVEVVCGAGADFLFMDFEHGLKDYSAVANALIAAELCDVPALVRIGEKSENLVARMLDAGAAGLLFSHVSTAQEAEELVSWCRYKPLGVRGSGVTRGFLRHYGSEYDRRQQASQDVACIMIVEDMVGVRNLEAILAVDGVTGVAIGPGDLSMELGVDRWDHPKVLELLDQMAATARGFPGQGLLRLCLDPAEASGQIASGTNMLLITHDVHLIKNMYKSLFAGFQAAVGASRER
ncbi:HpcH/HpaI aldolase family protein [Massilia sp. LXY-6]|uniref:HpcH/HpaI aldolase family protein n=1 Tax=Massilia sp. LXY-6 TaxID=3379823 RepID=UPI003EE1867D